MPIEQTQAPKPRSDIFQFLTLNELYALPEESTRFIVDNLLPTGGLSLLAGKPKAGKSHLARQLAASVATGQPFLGRDTVQGEVLYLALEEKPQEVARHFRTMGAESGIFTHTSKIPHSNPLGLLKDIAAQMEHLKLVIIDPLFKFFQVRDLNSYMEVSTSLESLIEFSRMHEAHILGVHHLSKRETEDPRDGTLGSSAINAAVDTVLTLQQQRETRVLSSSQRYGHSLASTKLDWNEDARVFSLAESVEAGKARGERETRDRIAFDIMRLLLDSTDITQDTIKDAITGKAKLKQDVLKELLDAERIVRKGNGQRGDPFLYSLLPIRSELETYPLPIAA